MLIVFCHSNDELVDKEKILVKFGQLHLFGPLLLRLEIEKSWLNLANYIYLDPVLFEVEY
jgi:hypothetical protein